MSGASFPTPLRVLVVDDCRDTTDSQAVLLKLWGHDARVAHDGPAALELARAYRPHVVLLDVALGTGMDGYAVARRLRALPHLEAALLVCMTGFGTTSDRRRYREAGFDHHLTKPADPEDLQRILAARKAHVPAGLTAPPYHPGAALAPSRPGSALVAISP
jgi:two-component system CheB/CheR fusion protein